MSYFASSDEEPIYERTRGSSRGRSKKSSSKSRRASRTVDLDWCEPSSEDERRQRRLIAKREERRSKSRERKLKKASSPPRLFFKKKKGSGRTRKEMVEDDLYATDYHEVNDGIIGCADDLCVDKSEYLQDDDGLVKPAYTPNNGKANKALDDEEEEVYVVRQRYGYFSIFFAVVQTIILAVMMWQCGIAPMNINPMFGPYPDALSEWGGKNSVLIIEDGQWWRLITPILLHAGVIHLLCNVAVQLELGVFFEREWGSMTWLIIYLTSAVGSSILSVIAMPDAVSVGSSGAVMGLFGGKLAEVICRACERKDTEQAKVAHDVRKEQCIGVTCSVVLVMAFSFIPYVDWAAHLGGLVTGLFVGFMTFSIHLESYCLRLVWFLVGAGLTLGSVIPCLTIMYSGDVQLNDALRDVCGYYSANFNDYQCNCMRDEYLANFNSGNDDDGGGNGQRMLYEGSSAFQFGY